jgi:putative redox protein
MSTPMRIELKWHDSLYFRSRTPDGRLLQLDGNSKQGASPMEALLSSLCGCLGIDVLDILLKGRFQVQSLTVEASGTRNPEPPRYFNSIALEIRLQTNAPLSRVQRAVQLSSERYCSVLHTLRPDLTISHTVDLQPLTASPGEETTN